MNLYEFIDSDLSPTVSKRQIPKLLLFASKDIEVFLLYLCLGDGRWQWMTHNLADIFLEKSLFYDLFMILFVFP